MHRLVFLLLALLSFQICVHADTELDERLKSVMLLFDKKQQQLKVEISDLKRSNEKLAIELEKQRSQTQALIAENKSLRKQLGISPTKQVETAASPRDLDSYRSFSSAQVVVGKSTQINVNNASSEMLELLPGVGPVIAKRIIDNRPYREVDDLLKVNGIGKTSIEILRPLVRVK